MRFEMTFGAAARYAIFAMLGFAVVALDSHNRAFAADPAYVGKWAADLSNCKAEQDQPDAPMIVTKSGYDQHEAHCTFKSVKETGPGEWKAKGSCSVEGDEQPMDDTLTVSGNTLSIGEPGNSQDLLRCP